MKPVKEALIDDLVDKIINQHYKPNSKLPTVMELTEYYGVSRYRMRDALKTLEETGLIVLVQGSGVFVSDQEHVNTLLYNSMTKKKYSEIESHMVSLKQREATFMERRQFNIVENIQVWEFERVRITNSRISQYEITVIPCNLFPILNQSIVEGSIHNYVTKLGYKISHQVTEYSSQNASTKIAEIMVCKKNKALTVIKNHGYLQDNILFEITYSYNLDYSCSYISKYNMYLHKNRETRIR